MSFETVKNMSEDYRIKGWWRIPFKVRVGRTYGQIAKTEGHEDRVFEKVFGGNDNSIVIRPNDYPLSSGPDVEQYVIWIRELEADPGIDAISSLISQLYFNRDYIVYLNRPIDRSIKTIRHYHALVRTSLVLSPSMPSTLSKLITFYRHANRQPIIKLPRFEHMLAELDPTHIPSLNLDRNPQLLPHGITNAKVFGQDMLEVYREYTKLFDHTLSISSPYDRCRDTAKFVLEGLGINIPVIDSPMLRPHALNDIKKHPTNYIDLDQPTLARLNDLYTSYLDLAALIEAAAQLDPTYTNSGSTIDGRLWALSLLGDYHSNLLCYIEMGVDIHAHISPDSILELRLKAEQTYNFLFDLYRKPMITYITELLIKTLTTPQSMVLCATHDTYIFLLLRHLAYINGLETVFEFTDYLSNIRIEVWTDGVTRVYYGSQYLGSRTELQ